MAASYDQLCSDAPTLDPEPLCDQECIAGHCRPRHDSSFAIPLELIAPWLPILIANAKMAAPRPWTTLATRIDMAVEAAITAKAARAVWQQYPVAAKL